MADVIALVDRREPALMRVIAALEESVVVSFADRALEARHQADVEGAEAVLFDAALAGEEFVERTRRLHPGLALVAWTARSSSQTSADLLEQGVDEVVHGGMTEREVVLRIRGALRRARKPLLAPIELGPLMVDAMHGEATWGGRDLMLTRREREVLEVLADSAGRTVRREVLYRRVWGYAMARGERSVDVNVRRLRKKLALVAGDELQVKTQPGIGYRLELVAAAVPADAVAV